MGVIDTLRCLNRIRLHYGDEDFIHWVLDDYEAPNVMKWECLGNENQGQILFSINEWGHHSGFFSELITVLEQLYFADRRGLIPIVKWGSRFLYYDESIFPGGVSGNMFTCFFQPVSEIENTEKSLNVVTAKDAYTSDARLTLGRHGYMVTESYVEGLAKIAKKYIQYNEETETYLEASYQELANDRERLLGVHFRGTDFKRQYAGHPRYIPIERYITACRSILKSKAFDRIFIASDEKEAVNSFQREFGDRVIFFQDTWRSPSGDESIAFGENQREHHRYCLAREIIRDQYMLTQCDGLLCGLSNVGTAARIMKKACFKDYETCLILDEGINKGGESLHR